MKIKPKKLVPGSTVGLVAPAGVFLRTKFKRGCSFLTSKGFKLVAGRNSHNKYGYMAGKDEERAADINDMFDDDSVDAIMCIRGGYGSSRILDMIDYELIRRKPKIFIGFSDPTALQLAIYKNSNLVSFYGPMLSFDFGGDVSPFTWECFSKVLSNSTPYGKISFPRSEGDYFRVINSGSCRGELLGGCISLIQTLIGTDYMPDLAGKILFLEDAGEFPYRLDRMFYHLKNAGLFNGLAGIVIGNTDIPRKTAKRDLTIEQILHDVFDDYDYPVVYNLPFGHCKDKVTIPQGITGYLSTSDRVLSFEESGVFD